MNKKEKDILPSLAPLKELLIELRNNGKIVIAVLYGSLAKGSSHQRSDVDLGLYFKIKDKEEEMDIVDKVLMSVDQDVSILRLDDEDESPFIIQEALKGIHLVEPDQETLYALWHRILHECESIRFRREKKFG